MNKTIFIDRDGVINKDPGGWTEYNYVTDFKDFHFLPGVLEALALLNRHRMQVIIISNQAGVNKGHFSKAKLDDLTAKMLSDVNRNGGKITDVFYCLHRNEDKCECRKPKPGLFEMAMRKHRVSRDETYMVGDSKVDVVAARRAGLKTILVLSGKTKESDIKEWEEKPDLIFPDLLSVVKWILAKERRKFERACKREKMPKRR